MIRKIFSKSVLACTLVLSINSLSAQTSKSVAQMGLKSSLLKGEILYKAHCLTCHQADGYGVPNMNPPLVKTNYVSSDKKKLIAWVLKGSGTTKLSINGKTFQNKMPPQQNLKDDEVADVLTYIRNSFGNKGTRITAEDVKAFRAANK
jgi:mono/diheme cytochrome c family protein